MHTPTRDIREHKHRVSGVSVRTGVLENVRTSAARENARLMRPHAASRCTQARRARTNPGHFLVAGI